MRLMILIAWSALFFLVPVARAAEFDSPRDLESVPDIPGNRRASDSTTRTTSGDSGARGLSWQRSRGELSAAEPNVNPALLCQVQNAIRWRAPAWPTPKCALVAAALNTTKWPRTFLGIAINESDLRDRAIAWHGPRVADVGLLGIRCHIGSDGKCTNGPARGYTVAQLRDVETNIAVGNVLLTNYAGNVSRWNAGSRGYAGRICALAEALDGRRVWVEDKRVRKLIEQIIAATGRNS